MLEQAAEQKAADFLHRMLRGESDGCNEMVLLAATLYLAQEVLSHGDKKKQKAKAMIACSSPTVAAQSGCLVSGSVPSQCGPECCCRRWPAGKAARGR